MKKIAILLTVFNRREKTLKCLESVYAQSSIPGYEVDVYMTNDGCTDGTPEAVAARFPKVHIIQGTGNLYWNRGMLKAWEAAAAEHDYDYYLWLNDDTIIIPQAIDLLLEASSVKNNKAIIVGATFSEDGKQATYGGRKTDESIPPESDTLTQVMHFNGNIVLVPKTVFKRIGMLDPYFFHSKGDFDYGMRASKAGIEIFQVGKYLGLCDSHKQLDKWCDPNVSFKTRWKMLHQPNGMPPHETFHLNQRHYGILSAVIHYFTVYLRCFFPSLWNNRNRRYLQHKC